MSALRYTIIVDGSSDRCLIHVINWLLVQWPAVAQRGFIPQVADPNSFHHRPGSAIERVHLAVQQFPCDLVLIHRDAENQPRQQRLDEIRKMTENQMLPQHVPIVPVRMTEAWLLLDEQAIRIAADNPNGRIPLNLPKIQTLEGLPDPKQLLWDLLITASEKVGRRREQFQRENFQRRQRVAELTHDFSPLRQLSAFSAFENDLKAAVSKWIETTPE